MLESQNGHFGQCVSDSESGGVSDQFRASFRPLLGLSLGHRSFQSLLEYLIPKTAVLEIKPQLRERKLIPPQESVTKYGYFKALFRYLIENLISKTAVLEIERPKVK